MVFYHWTLLFFVKNKEAVFFSKLCEKLWIVVKDSKAHYESKSVFYLNSPLSLPSEKMTERRREQTSLIFLVCDFPSPKNKISFLHFLYWLRFLSFFTKKENHIVKKEWAYCFYFRQRLLFLSGVCYHVCAVCEKSLCIKREIKHTRTHGFQVLRRANTVIGGNNLLWKFICANDTSLDKQPKIFEKPSKTFCARSCIGREIIS